MGYLAKYFDNNLDIAKYYNVPETNVRRWRESLTTDKVTNYSELTLKHSRVIKEFSENKSNKPVNVKRQIIDKVENLLYDYLIDTRKRGPCIKENVNGKSSQFIQVT